MRERDLLMFFFILQFLNNEGEGVERVEGVVFFREKKKEMR